MIKLKKRTKGKSELLGKFRSYIELAEFMEKKKLWGKFYAIPMNLKRIVAIRTVTRKRGGVGIYVEKYGYV